MTSFSFSDEQQEDWAEAQRRLADYHCKCGVCAANLYMTVRNERRERERTRMWEELQA